MGRRTRARRWMSGYIDRLRHRERGVRARSIYPLIQRRARVRRPIDDAPRALDKLIYRRRELHRALRARDARAVATSRVDEWAALRDARWAWVKF